MVSAPLRSARTTKGSPGLNWSLTTPGAVVFAVMFTLESLARATLATITPLQAYELLGDKGTVNLLYTGVYATTLCVSFAIPDLIRRFRRRWVYTLGVVMLIAAALLLSAGTLAGQVGGMLSVALAGSMTSVTLQLYMMDHIQRRDFVLAEPLRLVFSAAAWGAGPFLGVWLNQRFGHGTGQALSAIAATLLLGYFWYLRMTENPAVAAATRPPPRPLASIRRFLAQPRLRLGWFIAFGRSSWWSMFFVMPPLYLDRCAGHRARPFLGRRAGVGRQHPAVDNAVHRQDRRAARHPAADHRRLRRAQRLHHPGVPHAALAPGGRGCACWAAPSAASSWTPWEIFLSSAPSGRWSGRRWPRCSAAMPICPA